MAKPKERTKKSRQRLVAMTPEALGRPLTSEEEFEVRKWRGMFAPWRYARSVAAVVFAFGSKPGLTERQALEVADALAARRNAAAQQAAGKIRDQARASVDSGETSQDVDLDDYELVELAAVMTEVAWPDDEPQYAHLRRQLTAFD